jgi:hypothetical protein
MKTNLTEIIVLVKAMVSSGNIQNATDAIEPIWRLFIKRAQKPDIGKLQKQICYYASFNVAVNEYINKCIRMTHLTVAFNHTLSVINMYKKCTIKSIATVHFSVKMFKSTGLEETDINLLHRIEKIIESTRPQVRYRQAQTHDDLSECLDAMTL